MVSEVKFIQKDIKDTGFLVSEFCESLPTKFEFCWG